MADSVEKKIILQALGLYTYPNQISAPEGAMATATDVVVDRPGVIESSLAWNPYVVSNVGAGDGLADAFSPYPGDIYASVIASGGTTPISYSPFANGLYNFSTFGSPVAILWSYPDGSGTGNIGQVTSSFRANGNNYFCSGGYLGGDSAFGSGYVFRLDKDKVTNLPNTCRVLGAGMPQAMAPATYTGNPTFGGGVGHVPKYGLPLSGQPPFGDAASTILAGATGGAVAYRFLLATRDLQNNLVFGAPSGRTVVNSTVALTYGLVAALPFGKVGPGDILQVYRSETVAAGSIPSDDMRLVYEYIITSTDTARSYVTIVSDVCPDAQRGAALYTNDTQEGILQANGQLPNAALGVSHKGVAWYAGVSAKGMSAVLTMLGVTTGWNTGASASKITLGGAVTYTAVTEAAGENWPNQQFVLYTSSPSASTNLANTAQSIARTIAYNTISSRWGAQYLTDASGFAQQVQIYVNEGGILSSDVDLITFTNIGANTIAPSTPVKMLPFGGPSYLYFSKPNQPEHVPDLNYVQVGSPDMGINGLASLRDSLFVFKRDGLYRVTGTTPYTIRVEKFDATVSMLPGQHKSIAVAGNQIFALTSQGVVSITESGVQIIQRAIDDLIMPVTTASRNLSDSVGAGPYFPMWPAVGTATDSGRNYQLLLTDVNGSLGTVGAQILYRYNFVNNAWTTTSAPSWTANGTTGLCQYQDLTGTKDYTIITGIAPTSAPAQRRQNFASGPAGYVTTQSFSYCVNDVGDPSDLTRYMSITLNIEGTANNVAGATITFSSDSGASPVAVPVTFPAGRHSCKVAVPRAHALCASLSFTVSASSSGSLFRVNACTVSYQTASNRIPNGGRS